MVKSRTYIWRSCTRDHVECLSWNSYGQHSLYNSRIYMCARRVLMKWKRTGTLSYIVLVLSSMLYTSYTHRYYDNMKPKSTRKHNYCTRRHYCVHLLYNHILSVAVYSECVILDFPLNAMLCILVNEVLATQIAIIVLWCECDGKRLGYLQNRWA